MVKEIIFQIDSSIVTKAFREGNFLIEYANKSEIVENDLCIIYFSSNAIYYPNTYESFEHSICNNDNYEWKRNKFSNARKHIFLRDLHKQWYLTGINDTLNTPTKVLEFLRTETEGYRIFTTGCSAGGYGAILFGNLLECERIYSFNAQFNLWTWMKKSNAKTDPILFSKQHDDKLYCFFDLSNYISGKIDTYYFQSSNSKMDVEQYESISNTVKKKLKIIRFRTSNHGLPFLRINLKSVLGFSTFQLNKYVDKTIHPFIFSIQLIGIFPTITFILKVLKDLQKKKQS